jgi:biofilm PGA synthesis N-glycosyltransferase PgaC
MINYLDEFINYLRNAGWEKIFRVFWFFFLFEFFRFFIVDFTMLVIWRLKERSRQRKYNEARKVLWEKQPLISIIVPGKNEGKHLYKLVKSLEEQTYHNFELIVVDDGSNDDTEVIGKTLERNGLIKYFFRNDVRGGKASAANLGLRYCKGEIIVHLDADCSYDRDALENIILPFYLDEKIGALEVTYRCEITKTVYAPPYRQWSIPIPFRSGVSLRVS